MQLSMDAQQIELEIPGLPDQKNHQKLPSKKASASMIFRTLCGKIKESLWVGEVLRGFLN